MARRREFLLMRTENGDAWIGYERGSGSVKYEYSSLF